MSKAVIFFAPGLEECEGLLCVDILRRAGVEVTIAAVGGQKIVTSARGIHVVADALAEELDYAAFDACILPGGIPGVPNLKADATVKKVCQDFAAGGKLVAAICAGNRLLCPDRAGGQRARPAARCAGQRGGARHHSAGGLAGGACRQPDEHTRQGPRQLAVACRCEETDPRAGR